MLRLGIIGCGRVTSMFHLKAIQKLEEFNVAAISDVSKERMNDVQSGCMASEIYLDYRQLLEDDKVEAVAINTPPRFHESMVLEALENGKHVLCEKPL
ncbi:Gfo/Idh/MocA family oxidoreductase, partial [Candidatus Bathyarchaeota archaeon]